MPATRWAKNSRDHRTPTKNVANISLSPCVSGGDQSGLGSSTYRGRNSRWQIFDKSGSRIEPEVAVTFKIVHRNLSLLSRSQDQRLHKPQSRVTRCGARVQALEHPTLTNDFRVLVPEALATAQPSIWASFSDYWCDLTSYIPVQFFFLTDLFHSLWKQNESDEVSSVCACSGPSEALCRVMTSLEWVCSALITG